MITYHILSGVYHLSGGGNNILTTSHAMVQPIITPNKNTTLDNNTNVSALETNLSDNEDQSSHDEYDELDQIDFPITLITKENAATDNEADKQGQTIETKWKVVDENAILRCFDFSLVAHLQHRPVSRFEPISESGRTSLGQEGEACVHDAVPVSESKCNVDGESQPIVPEPDDASFEEKHTWTPAAVPLPPWALHS